MINYLGSSNYDICMIQDPNLYKSVISQCADFEISLKISVVIDDPKDNLI